MGLFDMLKETVVDVLGINDQPITQSQQGIAPQVMAQPAQPQQPSASGGVYDSHLERLIDLALADGELTEKEKQVLFKKAQYMGIDLDEFEMVLDARLYERNNSQPLQQAASSASSSDKYGDVKKCPACGAMIEAFNAFCPSCGHEFSNIKANSSIQRLFEMLNQVESESKDDATSLLGGLGRAYGEMFSGALLGGSKDVRKKKAIIQNFPIPTTKDDILEFLSLAVPLARKPSVWSGDKVAMEMYPIWKAKCEQVIVKAKFSMREDIKTLEMIAEYAKELKIKM